MHEVTDFLLKNLKYEVPIVLYLWMSFGKGGFATGISTIVSAFIAAVTGVFYSGRYIIWAIVYLTTYLLVSLGAQAWYIILPMMLSIRVFQLVLRIPQLQNGFHKKG